MKTKKAEFCENLDQNKISELMIGLQNKLNGLETVEKNDVNNYVEQLSDLFQNAAQKTFMKKKLIIKIEI